MYGVQAAVATKSSFKCMATAKAYKKQTGLVYGSQCGKLAEKIEPWKTCNNCQLTIKAAQRCDDSCFLRWRRDGVGAMYAGTALAKQAVVVFLWYFFIITIFSKHTHTHIYTIVGIATASALSSCAHSACQFNGQMAGKTSWRLAVLACNGLLHTSAASSLVWIYWYVCIRAKCAYARAHISIASVLDYNYAFHLQLYMFPDLYVHVYVAGILLPRSIAKDKQFVAVDILPSFLWNQTTIF